ncbi:unnamed protein product [Rotaria magnacalcarata]|uniref:BED-type domain-containing protein n=4 Tax=Rotaria magnacalcarata TaxID=392030 RepID=A0A815MNC0_9BILA|nr:unnamed protein product [Rotaria magnacalcarata]
MGSERWKLYFKFSSIDKNRINGLCKLCNQNYKDKNGTSSNFLKHLKRKHLVEYKQVFIEEDEGLPEEGMFEGDDQPITELSTNKFKQNRINKAIAKYLIIKCNLPLSMVENNAFREFIKECNIKWNQISAKTLKQNSIAAFTEKVNKTIYEELKAVDHLTLTVDGWCDRRCRSFLGITCHYIDSKMVPQSCLLDFIRLKSPHTGENIHETTERILDRFNMKEKVYKIVTDNTSSMIKAYKFGLSVDDEIIDDDNEVQLMANAHTTFNAFNQEVDTSSFHFINIPQDDGDLIDGDNPSNIRLSCFAHTLQLCIRDGLKNASYVPKVLAKCQALAKFSNKSSRIADLLEQLNKNINKMNLTRWNSEYMLIKSIYSNGKNDLELITSLMDNGIKFSNNDFIILEELIDILEPFYEISIKCQAGTAVTASLVVPSIVHLTAHLRDIKQNVSFCAKLIQQLQESIKTRFSGIFNRLNLGELIDNAPYADSLYLMAAVLDPSFKFYWIRDLQLSVPMETRLKQSIIQLIIDEMNNDSTTTTTELHEINFSSTTSSSFTTTPKAKRRKLFNYDDSRTNGSNESTKLDPRVELDAYLNDPVHTKFSDYWFHSQLKMLKKLIARLFSVQASSAPIERVFSHAGLILSSRRTNMNEQLFRDLVLLRVNQNLL